MSRSTAAAYDVIVVGAGSAGIGLCYNLSMKHPSLKILMLERGPSVNAPVASRCPMLSLYSSWFKKKLRPFQRMYRTTPEESLASRPLDITRGCGFGGSSLLDDMQYLRGTRADVESWGSDKWTWDGVSDALRRVQSNSRDDRTLHGEHAGPLTVSDASCALTNTNLNVRFFQACEAAGMPSSVDFNDGFCDGQGTAQSFIRRGCRVDVFDAMIMENKHRTPNLEIRSGANVARLLMQATGAPQCRGVVLASGEEVIGGKVVLCGGAIETPALLQRSGIGPAEVLEAAGIKPIVALEGVGTNLIAHPSVDITFRMAPNLAHTLTRTRSFAFGNLPLMYQQWNEYMTEGSGMFSSPYEATAFVRSADGALTPNLGLRFIPAPLLERGARWANFPGYTVTTTLHRPTSRGSVAIGANGDVTIKSGMLTEAADVAAMDEGIMWIGLLCGPCSPLQCGYYQKPTTELSFDAPFNGLLPTMQQPKTPIDTPALSSAFLRSASYVGQSLFGTCAMGSVVDDSLRVNGITAGNVLVADSSVVPQTTLGNSRTWNLALGLKCAELL